MRNDAALGEVVVDDGRVDESLGNDARLLDGAHHQVENPVRDGVAFATWVQLLFARTSHPELATVDVTLAKKESARQGSPKE